MTKEKFATIINRLREANDLQGKVDALFRNSRDCIESDFFNSASLQICHENVVVDLLEEIMEDKWGNISYFIYELDYGRADMAKDCLTIPETGENISLRTTDELWNWLQRERGEVQ